MKRLVLALFVGATAFFGARAEGYQVNSLSTKQLGMGHTGVGMKLGAESQIFNPAGMAFMEKTFDVSASVTGIASTAKITNMRTTPDGIGKNYESDNKVSTPIQVSAAFRVYDNLKVGVSFYVPYGSSINWGDNWTGAVLNQKVDLKTYTIQPTVAWKILPNLSIGAGINVAWGNVNLNKGLIPGGQSIPVEVGGTMVMVPLSEAEMVPVSATLEGNANLAVGYNIGAMWDILPEKLTFGIDYRSKMQMKVKKGDVTINYGNMNPALEPKIKGVFDNIDNANFAAQMPMPAILQMGLSYKPIDKLTLAFDAQLTFWNAYKALDIEFANASDFNQHIVKNYHNSWCYHLGAQYAATERFDVRAGLMIDTTPVNKKHYNPETPGMTKVEPTIGLSFRPINNLSIDFALMYVAGMGMKNTQCSYRNFLTEQTETIYADYKLHAWVPSLGLSYSF